MTLYAIVVLAQAHVNHNFFEIKCKKQHFD